MRAFDMIELHQEIESKHDPKQRKTLRLLRCKVDGRPVVHLAIIKPNGRSAGAVDLNPGQAGSVIDWLMEREKGGWA